MPASSPPDPPAHPIPIWLGAVSLRTLAVIGAHVDGWAAPLNISFKPATIAHRQAAIDPCRN